MRKLVAAVSLLFTFALSLFMMFEMAGDPSVLPTFDPNKPASRADFEKETAKRFPTETNSRFGKASNLQLEGHNAAAMEIYTSIESDSIVVNGTPLKAGETRSWQHNVQLASQARR